MFICLLGSACFGWECQPWDIFQTHATFIANTGPCEYSPTPHTEMQGVWTWERTRRYSSLSYRLISFFCFNLWSSRYDEVFLLFLLFLPFSLHVIAIPAPHPRGKKKKNNLTWLQSSMFSFSPPFQFIFFHPQSIQGHPPCVHAFIGLGKQTNNLLTILPLFPHFCIDTCITIQRAHNTTKQIDSLLRDTMNVVN